MTGQCCSSTEVARSPGDRVLFSKTRDPNTRLRMSGIPLSPNDPKSQLPRKEFAIAIGVGAGFILLYALQFAGKITFFAVLAVAASTAGAALFIGGFLGFLFGIPRTLQGKQTDRANSDKTPENDERLTAPSSYNANTNLEEISDRLTKILVGVGLTEIDTIADSLDNLAHSLEPGLGGTEGSYSFGLALLLYFFICGFLSGFLLTRLALPAQFASADLEVFDRLRQVADATEENQQQYAELQNKLQNRERQDIVQAIKTGI